MKHLFFSILCLSLFVPMSPAMAEYLQGTVVDIDQEKGEIEIALSRTGYCRQRGMEAVGPESDEQAGEQEKIVVKAAWFPRCLAKGSEIYARGEFSPQRKDLFVAEEVFACRGRGGHDPTGVRSRFHHHRRKMMMRQKGGDMHD